MKNSLETRLGMFILLAMMAAFVLLQTVGVSFKPGFHVRAQFNNVQELKVGDAVKMAGVPVGRVDRIALADNKVEITMRLNKDTPVKTDSKATIKFAGLLGQNYVSLDFGGAGAPPLVENSIIASVEQPDLSSLMAKLDDVATGVQNLTKSFTGEKIDNLLGPFTDFMKNNNPRLTAMIANLQAVSAQIAEGKGTIGKLINDDALYNSVYSSISNLQDTAIEIKHTAADARTMLAEVKSGVLDPVNAGQGTLGKLVKDDTLYRETTATMVNLRQISDKMNQGQGTVGKLINDQEFYKNAKLTLQKLDKATEGLEDSGPLSVVGTMVQTLF